MPRRELVRLYMSSLPPEEAAAQAESYNRPATPHALGATSPSR
jgi:hypothetical protein